MIGGPDERFRISFAAGENSRALSGTWTVFAGRRAPDLYLAAGPLGGTIRASVHFPRPNRVTSKRHFKFVRDAKGEVVDKVRADGGIDNELNWRGAQLSPFHTLEGRIFVLGTTLLTRPREVGNEVTLLHPPGCDQCLVISVIIGLIGDEERHPREEHFETHVLTKGHLSDGKTVWILYCYTPAGKISFPEIRNPNPRRYVAEKSLNKAQDGELLGYAVASCEDGALGFFNVRVERTT